MTTMYNDSESCLTQKIGSSMRVVSLTGKNQRLFHLMVIALLALGTLAPVASARVLHADLGRWLRRDPLGYVDGWNVYEYVTANPLMTTDPDGQALLERDFGGPSNGGTGGSSNREGQLCLVGFWEDIYIEFCDKLGIGSCARCFKQLRELGKKKKCNRKAQEQICYHAYHFQHLDPMKLTNCLANIKNNIKKCLNDLKKTLPECINCTI